jgi:methionine-rich copper-binding protein CopC
VAQNPAGREPAARRPNNGTSTSGPDWDPVRPQRRRRVVAAVVALAMLLTLLGGTAVTIATAFPASAHDQLVDSDPKDGAELDEPADTITLTYSAEIIADGTQVRVTTPDGEVDAAVTVDGTDVVADLGEQTSGGEYVAAWRVVSSDGHPIEGEVAWTVADQPEAAPSEAAEEPVPAASAEASQEAAGELEGLGAMAWVYGVAVVAIVGVALALLARSRRSSVGSEPTDPHQGPQD